MLEFENGEWTPEYSSVDIEMEVVSVVKRKFLGVTLDVSEEYREGFSDTNKKINYRTR
jgi:hypothetical protein